MMAEYVLIFFGLMIVLVGLFSLYKRYFKAPQRKESDLYINALQDLLDSKQETAFSKLRQVVTDDSNNIDAYIRLGQILRENNKPQQALQVHKDLTLRGDLSAREKIAVLRQLYYDYNALDNMETAEAALNELISLQPQNRWAYRKLLEVQKKARRWNDAYDTAVNILKMESNKSKKPLAVFKYHLGDDLRKKREYHKARILFKEALGLDPTFVSAYLSIGDSYIEEKRLEDAVNFWYKLIEAVPDKGHLVIERLQKTLFELGRFGDIADICENILKHSPENIKARMTLSEFYEKKGDIEASEKILEQLVDDNPEDLKAIIGLTRIYLGKGENRKVERLFRSLEHKWDRNHRFDQETVTKTSPSSVK